MCYFEISGRVEWNLMFKSKTRLLALCVSLFVSTQVFAEKVLLISDIDDTIKVSHVLSTAGKLSRAADVTTPFRGMSELYQKIVKENKASIKVVYLSNAPEQIAGIPALKISHQTFLNFNDFPPGDIDLRESLFVENHKVTEVRRLIELVKPEVVIMLGDNGEKDVDVYHQMESEFAGRGIQMHTFIHQLYNSEIPFYIPDFFAEQGRKLYAEQTGFVTPIEISLKLNELGLFSQKSLNKMIHSFSSDIIQEQTLKWDGLRPITFPFFKNCADFKWTFSRSSELQRLIQKIEAVCN
jgi:hypothetical protein